jgi:hypothetical protein
MAPQFGRVSLLILLSTAPLQTVTPQRTGSVTGTITDTAGAGANVAEERSA